MNVRTKFKVRSSTRSGSLVSRAPELGHHTTVPAIIGVLQNLGRPWNGYAHGPFSPKFLMGFYSDGPCGCIPAKF